MVSHREEAVRSLTEGQKTAQQCAPSMSLGHSWVLGEWRKGLAKAQGTSGEPTGV